MRPDFDPLKPVSLKNKTKQNSGMFVCACSPRSSLDRQPNLLFKLQSRICQHSPTKKSHYFCYSVIFHLLNFYLYLIFLLNKYNFLEARFLNQEKKNLFKTVTPNTLQNYPVSFLYGVSTETSLKIYDYALHSNKILTFNHESKTNIYNKQTQFYKIAIFCNAYLKVTL